ncbi:hypothetical protein MKX01_035272, partial [Papaver californicum]
MSYQLISIAPLIHLQTGELDTKKDAISNATSGGTREQIKCRTLDNEGNSSNE